MAIAAKPRIPSTDGAAIQVHPAIHAATVPTSTDVMAKPASPSRPARRDDVTTDLLEMGSNMQANRLALRSSQGG
jgi:hypothetical protein